MHSENFPYHKMFLRHLENLLKKIGVRSTQVFSSWSSSLEFSDSYDSKEKLCFRGMEFDETQENEQQAYFKNYFFCLFFFRYR